ncbi:putative cyclic nucleotide-gated cation channel beta-1-like [Scophthalmus maximus]|uniref:Putative cyclic nucleotide-gated cation channel beta-1-like n=1 Tax=Scophthalmus maximus TaxID=52904 RepID=A0A2U9BX24_SCOMX|nr:putative cyclic nucleotide-gated cation channel beta-1-like [Scophthalmus maximus]
MVLEDVDSDNEGHCNAAVPSTKLDPPSPATTTTPQQQEATRRTQTSWQPPAASTLSQVCGDVGPVAALSDGVEKMSQEDAETQTGRWTPFIESIKREAEDVALATMEERLLYERMEMARMAEEVARQTAEMAIRQMASEGQSIKLSLGSAELLEEPEAGCLVLYNPALQVVTKSGEEEATGDDCGAPVSCDAFESCLMRIPHTSECLGNINAFFKENGISPPKIPPMPKLPTQFSDVTKYFPSLPPDTLELPNVPSYPRLPPIVSPPSKQLSSPSRQLTGLSNPAFFIEDDSDVSPVRPAGPPDSSSLSLRPAVNVEDVDSDHERKGGGEAAAAGGGGGEEQSAIPKIFTPQDPRLTTLTVPVTPSGGRQSRRLRSQSEDDDDEGCLPVRAWPSQSSLHSTDDV